MNIVLFSPDEVGNSGDISLPPADPRAVHIRSVLRLEPGARFRAGIIDGMSGTAEVRNDRTEGVADNLLLRFLPDRNERTEVLPRVDVILGSVRPIQLKRLFRDLSSIGVSHIMVAGTDLSEASYFHSNIWKPARLRGFLVEGASQGGHTSLPEVARSRSIDEAVAACETIYESVGTQAVSRMWLERGARSASVLPRGKAAGRILLAIGPERGFTERETGLLEKAGFEPLGIPVGILRTETAATAAVCIVSSWSIGP